MTDIVVVGPLAHPKMLAVFGLAGQPVAMQGSLQGGAQAGIAADGWPHLRPGDAPMDGVRITPNPALQGYAQVMGLEPVDHQGETVLGVSAGTANTVDDPANWSPDLAAEIAAEIVPMLDRRSPDQIARRLDNIGVWAASRLRGRASDPSGGDVVALRQADDVRVIQRDEPFAGFFAAERWQLQHRLHDGGFTPTITREGFLLGDAVVVLPWDPVRDRVHVIEQFRMSPAMRCDPQPWLLETVAGRVDAGETPEQAGRREALEEAAITLDRLIPAIHHYPSPGAVGEFLYMYIGIADLPDDIAGVHGLDGEAEDIRGHLLDREVLTQMALDGQIVNGPLAMLILWLAQRKDTLLNQG